MPGAPTTLFGVSVASSISLPRSFSSWTGFGNVVVTESAIPRDTGHVISRHERAGFCRLELDDGSFLVRWDGLGKFLVSGDGGSVTFERLGFPPDEDLAFQLSGPVLSFVLINKGIDSVHASCVDLDGVAVAFAADQETGKSTFAAACVASGGRLVTDDVLVNWSSDDTTPLAIPGPAHLKIGAAAQRLLLPGVEAEEMSDGERLLIRLSDAQAALGPVPLVHLFVLDRSSTGADVRFAPLDARSAFVECVRHTFNSSVDRRSRLTRHFAGVVDLVQRVPICRLSIPEGLEHLPSVVGIVREHVMDHALER